MCPKREGGRAERLTPTRRLSFCSIHSKIGVCDKKFSPGDGEQGEKGFLLARKSFWLPLVVPTPPRSGNSPLAPSSDAAFLIILRERKGEVGGKRREGGALKRKGEERRGGGASGNKIEETANWVGENGMRRNSPAAICIVLKQWRREREDAGGDAAAAALASLPHPRPSNEKEEGGLLIMKREGESLLLLLIPPSSSSLHLHFASSLSPLFLG